MNIALHLPGKGFNPSHMHPIPILAAIPALIPVWVAQVATPEIASGWERAGIGAIGLGVSFVCFQSLKRVYENGQKSAADREDERAKILQGILDSNNKLVDHLIDKDIHEGKTRNTSELPTTPIISPTPNPVITQ